MTPPLASWTEGRAKQTIFDFVDKSVVDMPPEERIAVFDNDGTLWCERPMPIQADFIVRRLAQMAHDNAQLRRRQPWKAAIADDFDWFARVIDNHYAGDDTEVPTLLAGILQAFAGITVDEFEAASAEFLHGVQHPTLVRPYVTCAYAPMVELLVFLHDHGFANYIVSGGGRDFMRPISEQVYGVPRDCVIGSTSALEYRSDASGGTIVRKADEDVLDDGPEKPVRIWSRVGRRPIFAAGNANGDVPMLDFAQQVGRPSLRLLIVHDDAEREFDYSRGAELARQRATDRGWVVVSIRHDWATVFAPAAQSG